MLSPMLFSLYISPIAHIVNSFGLLQQQYADDKQLYITISKDNHFLALNQFEHWLAILHTWFCHNGLALNPDNSDTIIFGTAQHTHSLPNLSTVNVAGAIVPIFNHIKLLGVTLDSRLTFDTHISALSKSCFSIFGPSVTSVQHLPQILPRALHVLSLAAVSTMPMQPWSASLARIRSTSAYPEYVGSSGYSPMQPH